MPLSPGETTGLVVLVLLILIFAAIRGARIGRIEKRMAALNRIDAKLDLLLKQANITYDPYRGVAPEIAEALREGQMIKAIKLYRRATGVGLKEAKEFVEGLQRKGG